MTSLLERSIGPDTHSAPASETSSTEQWMRIGAEHWPRTYGSGMKLHSDLCAYFSSRYGDLHVVSGATALFACCWAEAAYPKLVTGHKFAAALMCTPSDPSMLEDVHIPWKTFVVAVPNGLLTLEDREYDSIGIMIDPAGDTLLRLPDDPRGTLSRFIMILSGQGGRLCRMTVALDAADGLFKDVEEDNIWALGGTMLERDRKERLLRCARRLVVGLLVAMQNTRFADKKTHQANSVRRSGAPNHRAVYVGAPIATDCRPSLERYITGTSKKHTPPSMQSLVRGHYKRQVVGMDRRGRKVLWIEPYWRGPEDAPILIHPYSVGMSSR